MENQTTEVAVLGAGPGGYAAAFRAADLGKTVTLIDPEANPGGVCLYRGCVPSKALLHVAALLEETKHASAWGVTYQEPVIDLDRLRAYKDDVVKKMTGGLGMLTKSRKIRFIRGTGSFSDGRTLFVKESNGTESTVTFEHCIIATGSRPVELPHLKIDSERMMDSTGALSLPVIPKSLLCIGGGIIGMELATVYAALGTEVSVVEMLPKMLGPADPDLTNILMRRMKSRLKASMTDTKVVSLQENKKGIETTFEASGGAQTKQTYDRILMCIGRRPNSENLGLENTGVQIDERGFIQSDAQCRTADAAIFAIGDVIGNPMLAHKGTHEGHVAAEVIAGKKVRFDPATIPSVVYTNPEVAWCGLTETEAKAEGIPYKLGKFPWAASGRATAMDRTDGLTKILFDPESERVLGMGIVGCGAGELIGEGVLAVEMSAVALDLALSIHPHPTMTETIMESAEVFLGHSDHYFSSGR